MAENDGDGFDLIEPSLIQQLKKILDQYPDDDQILKEIIQNAEDAGATQVKFLYDKNSFGTARLYDEELAQFQGPALYAYNNAMFTQEDWKGIRLVSDSIKVEDPMKVGRFGLGFKSVFHLTDLPSILSDSRIGFIDPHGVYFSDKRHRRTGKNWRLKDVYTEMESIPDQFLPYKGVFGGSDKVFSQGYFDGTLFRFPLRVKPSELSETLYTPEKMDALFESFKADAHMMLLFLQHVESIELYVREESDPNSRRLFQVKIAEKSLQTVRVKRKEFCEKITPGEVMPACVSVTYPITIETVDFDLSMGEAVRQQSFLITNYLCGGKVSSQFKRLMTDKELGYLPTVGVAMALPTDPKHQTPTIQGHVFCSLPLPMQKTSLTGLPVHVNGFFALSQNRRYIKTPNAEQEDQVKAGWHLTDKSLLWNKCLLEEAIPRAYATVVMEAISGSSHRVPKLAIYKAWPDVNSIDHKWKGIEEPFFHLLLADKVVHTKAKGGKWVNVKEAIFERLLADGPKDLLMGILLSVNLPAVTVPVHVLSAIDVYAPDQAEITPSFVRRVLRQVPSCYTSLHRRDKLLLLKFSLSDGEFKDLDSLQLLPLANGKFEKFEHRARPIYLSTPNHPQELLPGLDDRFLDRNVDEDILQSLQIATSKGHMQLQFLSKECFTALLWCSLPPDWRKGDAVSWYPGAPNLKHPPKDWIKLVWRYLRDHFSTAEDIQSLGKPPLIPLSMTHTPVTLTRLCCPSRIVVKHLHDVVLSNAFTDVLNKLGLVILSDLPSFISHHPGVVGNFVNPPSVHGVLNALLVSSSNITLGKLVEIVRRGVPNESKHVLRSFLANVQQLSRGTDKYKLLCSLPIFETLSKTFVSKQECPCAAPAGCLPIPILRDLINIAQGDSKRLAILLDVRILKPTELLCEMVFPDVQQRKYSEEQIDKLMVYVLEHFTQVIRTDANFQRNLQMMAFVPKQGRRVRALDLFDPRNDTLKKIFAKENVFPVGMLYNKQAVLEMLQVLGMKTESDITGRDLYQSAQLVSKLENLPTAEEKSKAIFQYLRDHPQKLQEQVNCQPLGVLLRDISWVSRLQQRNPNFPLALPWWNQDKEEVRYFFKPAELTSHEFANLIGTVKPVVEVKSSSQIARYFSWQSIPEILDVVKHLKNLIGCYSKEEKPYYMVVVNEIYSFLSHLDDAAVIRALGCLEISEWVWNGDGFSSPKHLLSSKPLIDLAPYILSLPSEMMRHSHLFYRFGLREQSDPSVLLQVLSMIKEKYDDDDDHDDHDHDHDHDHDVQFTRSEVKRDLQLSVDILNEVASGELPPDLQAKILLPVYNEGNMFIQLEPVEHCMYCEHDWLKTEGDDRDIDYFYVHPNVPNSTADRLGVPTLTNRLLDPDELFIGEEFGHEEKLTTRLSRLLDEYTDGFAVLKELLQNADDSGATEVRFLYDERVNDDATTCLIDEGMRGCQGPALWAYNDATFKEEDFVNITKLNEATKEHDTEKIGRFGLGFSAVYNLTDVPMFVSKNYFAILDPHTSFLGKAIKNKRRPGMKININKDVNRLRAFSNQFKPFNGIFGCDLHLNEEDNSFDGTLFRFPLRTKEQAIASEIKKLHYSDQEMRGLLQMFIERAQTLLLFTQNVFRVGIYSLTRSSSPEPQPSLLFQVTKSLSQDGILRELSISVSLPVTTEKLDVEQQRFLSQCNFLQASSKFAKSAKNHTVNPREFPKSSLIVDVNCSFSTSGLNFFTVDQHRRQECSTWLVVSSMGNGQAMQLAANDPSLLPSAGVAVQLVSTESNAFMPSPVLKSDSGWPLNGTVFCYLPLPIHSGLPVHINGSFSVAANRRQLKTQLKDDKTCPGVQWNNELMQDSILSAYLCLLEDVKKVAPDDGSYIFHSLWPKASEVHQDFWPVLTSFYSQLARGVHALFSSGCDWVEISQAVFLHPDLRQDPDIGEAAFAVLQNLFKENTVVIDMPPEVFLSFRTCGQEDVIRSRAYTKRRFFVDLFFPNIFKVRTDLRDLLVLYAMDHNTRELDDLLRMHACIPASPDGKTLKCPSQLVHPNKEASFLFSSVDGRFPCGTVDTFLDLQRLAKLEQLGMASNDLSWLEVAGRAKSVQWLNAADPKVAFKRVKALLEFLENKVKHEDKSPSQLILSSLQTAHFLPVLQKPKAFPLSWKGDEFHRKKMFLLAPKDIFVKEDKYLVCCTEPIVASDLSKKVKEFLRLGDRKVTTKHVMNQLEEAISINIGSLNRAGVEEVSRVCKDAYAFLQDNMEDNGSSVQEWLRKKSFILVGKTFLPANRVAMEMKCDCSPYLYSLPDDLADRYFRVMKLAGVRGQFEEKDYISSLRKVKEQLGAMKLDEKTLQVAVNMAIQLGETLHRSGDDLSKVQAKWGTVYLPDNQMKMRAVPDLCFKDCPWIPDDSTVQFVNEKIPWSTCVQLGVKTRREEALQEHDSGIPFGQQEKLTNRLKRILTGYPSEKEILKELLQNADDSQASEICFIKDPRHHPDEKLFKDSWKRLQGPALCVYNNKPFTDEDIKGIQSLGEGSKGDDVNKTGQYGVGFNAVYHLTDVPSFRSNGKEIGDVLCVFDPHCKYVPNASDKEPGRMFKDIKKLKKKFPDVFPCYLEGHFPMKNATMFRLPLKTEEMAKESKISSTPVTVEKLDEMMEDLKKELFEVLLFVNNVKKISLSAVDDSGKLVHTYSVEVLMSKEDDKKRQAFAHCMRKIANQAKKEDLFLPTNVEVNKCIYTLKLRDCFGMEEKWLIVQQVGFEKPVEMSIVDAFKKQQLGMLPRGGVACLLESNKSVTRMQGKKKPFCFLPLPFETDLPVHINGHFALDHEARRNLWRDEVGGYRSEWNNALLSDVIASCYLTLLDEVRGFLQLPVTQDTSSINVKCSRSTLSESLRTYEDLFPSLPIDDPHWRTLVSSVCQEMNKKGMHLIPVVRSLEGSSSGRTKEPERVQLKWFPPTGTGKERAYFNDLEVNGSFAQLPEKRGEDEDKRKKREEIRIKRRCTFEDTLLKTGFNLAAFSMNVFDSLRQAGVKVFCISPSAVMEFYKSFNDADPLCNVGKIPCPVDKTPFKNEKMVVRFLQYCKDDENFLENLTGLPLLLTQDNYLRPFSESDPLCLSRYPDILPRFASIFVHSNVLRNVFNDVESKRASVFRSLDINTFASHLHQTLPGEFLSDDHFVRWCPDDSGAALPNPRWIFRVWNFLQEAVSGALKKSEVPEERCKIPFIREMLSPLSKWCLLPAVQREVTQTSSSLKPEVGHFLVSIDMAESIIGFSDGGASHLKLVEVLRKMGLPELHSDVITKITIGTTTYTKMDSFNFARHLVATLDVPNSILSALKRKLQKDPVSLQSDIKPSDAVVVLEYFSHNIKSITDENNDTLRKLPFYPRASGGLAKLGDSKGFIIPGEIPKEEMDVVESKLGCLFLESCGSLSGLYKSLEVELLSCSEVYLKFILKCFQYLSTEGKLAHLQYLRSLISLASTDEKEHLLDSLKVVPFLPSKDGTMMTVSSFYDPKNIVFASVLSEDKFPPKPFNSDKWLPFLVEIGLVQDVSQEDFLRFASQIAYEAATARTENTVKKSKVLLHHLLARPNLVREGLLRRIRDIPFITPHTVEKSLKELCPPFLKKRDGQTPFVAFKGTVLKEHEEIVWTKAALLPQWADPRHYPLTCSHWNFCRCLDSFLSQLQVVETPSVDDVVGHCQTVCSHVESNSDKINVSPEKCSTLRGVMEHFYRFLQREAIGNSKAKHVLQTTRCVLVEQGRKFILPCQAVLELYEDLEIRPFLYRVPPEFGKFQEMFEFLGCAKSVRATHYAMVLEMLHQNCQGARLHPNEVSICSKAVKGFFNCLQKNPEDASSISQLYLPAVSSRFNPLNTHLSTIPITLRHSSELMFNDASAYRNRIKELDQLFVFDLSLMKVSCKSALVKIKDLITKLPSASQPRMLSSAIKEKLSHCDDANVVTSGAVIALRQQLSSAQFRYGVVRVVRHVNWDQKDFNEEFVADIERGLQSIELCAVKGLKTSLFLNNNLILGSEEERPYFHEKQEVCGKKLWKVYVNSVTEIEDIISSVSKVIVEMYGNFLGKEAFVIPIMLRHAPGKIWSLLDRMGIQEDDTCRPVEMDIYPEPGTFIPIEDHHLLNDSFEEFRPGEYVGYQLDDPSLHLKEGVPTYIYATIVEEVADEDAGLMTKVYKINVGHGKEPAVVSAADLHKFHRLKEISDRQVKGQRNKQQVFYEISGLLKDAFRLQEEKRRQIVKRLFLRWHPDKNLGDEEFSTEVFQHIQSTISQLEGSYSNFFASWEARAKEHGSQREEYKESFSKQYGAWESSSEHPSWQNVPPSFCKRNSQPGEAARWFRQAEADLAAGANEVAFSRPSYEWACFKCHQAAEKALKAVQFKVDADKMNVHSLVDNSHVLDDPELTQLAIQLESLVGDSTRMRYPDRMCYPQIPNDVYSAEMAMDALGMAKKIVERVKSRLT